MTITVQAGMPIGRLREVLAEEKQQLPIDCHDSKITIGAMVASNTAGSRQFGYGTLRDYLIGMEAVDGQGRIFHAGGRVVKNVAGYDLCRLMIGSRGALGVLTQVTLKVKPIPEQQRGFQVRLPTAASFERALERLNLTAASPVLMDFTCHESSDDDAEDRSLWLGVEGTPDACKWQIKQLKTDCDGDEVSQLDALTDYANAWAQRGKNDWRLRCLPSELPTVTSGLLDLGVSSRGYAGSGILFIQTKQRSDDQLVECRRFLAQHNVRVIDWHTDHPSRATDALSVRLRKAFDPHSLFTS